MFLHKRLIAHNSGKGAKYTRGRRPVKLVYAALCEGQGEALRQEARIKRMSREKKLDLIENRHPNYPGLERKWYTR